MIGKQIIELAEKHFGLMVELRRHLHKNPELSFKEFETSKFIKTNLSEWGISYTDNWVETGIVAEIEGRLESEKTFALRADIDALPIKEIEGRSYGSQNENVMHACGHDVHSTCLLGAIKILNDLKDYWGGTVKCIFQPGEEKLPGGASLMIKEGLIDHLNSSGIVGQHVHPPLAVGKVGFHPGSYMASADELYVTITGKGGHAALPGNVLDPIAIASQLILDLNELEQNLHEEQNPIVLSIGKFNTVGGATNVIPDQVKLEGTFRAMDETKRYAAHKEMLQLSKDLSSKTGGTIEMHIIKGYPVLYNDPSLTEKCIALAEELIGTDNVVRLPKRMTSEGFSFYSQEMPGCFYRLGTGNTEKGIISPVHTPTFDIDEEALKVGAAMMAFLAVENLK